MADSDSSSDSDDEYLTKRDNDVNGRDREALVRRKLLENFYGKSTGDDNNNDNELDTSNNNDDNDDSTNNNGTGTLRQRNSSSRFNVKKDTTIGRDDLDSANFDAKYHIDKLINTSTVHELLETEDRLALQVRTLESTMQTLVYENYSRFIDATDAIRSIGVNVQANERSLHRLSEGMELIDNKSKDIEDSIGSLRDQVAEKLRIKRLLTRLDALLKLPQTLREQIIIGKYNAATKSYLSASTILRKHSDGFESLKTIETDCNTILVQLDNDLTTKIRIWSGRQTPFDHNNNKSNMNSTDSSNLDDTYDDCIQDNDDDDVDKDSLYQPKNIAEVFECAGTLFLLRNEDTRNVLNCLSTTTGSTDQDLTIDELISMSVASSMRLLDRQLDDHLIQVQERKFAHTDVLDRSFSLNQRMVEQNNSQNTTSTLLPDQFLNTVIEGARLYAQNFGNYSTTTKQDCLTDYVKEAMASYFAHVRSILYEESIDAIQGIDNTGDDTHNSSTVDEELDGSKAFLEISNALTQLVYDVRQVSSNLLEIGLNGNITDEIINQALNVCDSLIRRRVDQKFIDLRLSIVRHCLVPFVNHAIDERKAAMNEDKPILDHLTQLASTTLSDCLQLIDDTIRSILSDGLTDASGDFPDPKDAIRANNLSLSNWLANTFEVLAGGEWDDPKYMVEAMLPSSNKIYTNSAVYSSFPTTGTSTGGQEQVLLDTIEESKMLLVGDETSDSSGNIHADFLLVISELCRLASNCVAHNLNQSVAYNTVGSKKKSKAMFPDDANLESNKDCEITARFCLAASRVLVMYAADSGSRAGNVICSDIRIFGGVDGVDMPLGPRDEVWHMLKIAKTASLECAKVFGGSPSAGPIPECDISHYATSVGALLGRKSGLQLDVERMFKESVTIFPHPSEILESSRNSIIFLLFKVCFRELVECIRSCCFSLSGVAQLLVDIEFLRHMLPHYISTDFNVKGTNAYNALCCLLDDSVDLVVDRLGDGNYIDIADLRREALEIISSFIMSAKQSNLLEEFTILEDQEVDDTS